MPVIGPDRWMTLTVAPLPTNLPLMGIRGQRKKLVLPLPGEQDLWAAFENRLQMCLAKLLS